MGYITHAEAEPPGRRQDARVPPVPTAWLPSSRWVVRRSSVVSGSVRWKCGPWGLRCRLYPAGNADRQVDDVNGRTKMYKNIVDGDHRMEAGHARILQRIAEGNPLSGYQHRAGTKNSSPYSPGLLGARFGSGAPVELLTGEHVKDLLKFLKARARPKSLMVSNRSGLPG